MRPFNKSEPPTPMAVAAELLAAIKLNDAAVATADQELSKARADLASLVTKAEEALADHALGSRSTNVAREELRGQRELIDECELKSTALKRRLSTRIAELAALQPALSGCEGEIASRYNQEWLIAYRAKAAELKGLITRGMAIAQGTGAEFPQTLLKCELWDPEMFMQNLLFVDPHRGFLDNPSDVELLARVSKELTIFHQVRAAIRTDNEATSFAVGQ